MTRNAGSRELRNTHMTADSTTVMASKSIPTTTPSGPFTIRGCVHRTLRNCANLLLFDDEWCVDLQCLKFVYKICEREMELGSYSVARIEL